MSLPYSKKTIENFVNPKNVGEIENPDAVASEGSPACGDMIRLYLKIDKEKKIIEDIKFKSYGCASNIAASSVITQLAKGKTITEAKQISWKTVLDNLGGLPPIKVHCAVLSSEALKTAIENYENEHGLLKEKKNTDNEIIRNRLKKIIDPQTGKDIISADIFDSSDIKDGKITIFLKISEDNQFLNNIKDEIQEKLKPLWDIKEIIIKLTAS